MEAEISDGGLRLRNIETFDVALKIIWAIRTVANQNRLFSQIIGNYATLLYMVWTGFGLISLTVIKTWQESVVLQSDVITETPI